MDKFSTKSLLYSMGLVLLCLVLTLYLFVGSSAIVSQDKTVADAMRHGNYKKAAALLENLETGPSSVSRLTLGNLYFVGLGVERDYDKAGELFRKAALQGNSAAQYNLGLMYHNGLGIEKNDIEAAAWFLLADSGGLPRAETYLRRLSGTMNPNKIQEANALKRELTKQIESAK